MWFSQSLSGTSTVFCHLGMGQYLLIPFLVGWTSIYQLFWGSLGTRVLTHPHLNFEFKHGRLDHGSTRKNWHSDLLERSETCHRKVWFHGTAVDLLGVKNPCEIVPNNSPVVFRIPDSQTVWAVIDGLDIHSLSVIRSQQIDRIPGYLTLRLWNHYGHALKL